MLRFSWREGSLLGKYWSRGQALCASAPREHVRSLNTRGSLGSRYRGTTSYDLSNIGHVLCCCGLTCATCLSCVEVLTLRISECDRIENRAFKLVIKVKSCHMDRP